MKELTKNQKWYYRQIMKLGKNKKVLDLSYDELFLTLDRVKFAYLFDFATKNEDMKRVLKKKLK